MEENDDQLLPRRLVLEGMILNGTQHVLRTKKLTVDNKFIRFYFNKLKLNPSWEMYDSKIHIKNVQRVTSYIVKKIETRNDPDFLALRIQFNDINLLKLINQYQEDIQEPLRVGINIIKTRVLEQQASNYEMFISCMLTYFALTSGLGNPKDKLVLLEIKKAFDSIVRKVDFDNIFSNPYAVREERFIQLSHICAGIRLYNKDCNLGGAGIKNLPCLLRDSFLRLRNILKEDIIKTVERKKFFYDVLDSCYVLNQKYFWAKFEEILPKDVTKEDITMYKNFLIVYHQFEICLRNHLIWLNSQQDKFNEIEMLYESTLQILHFRVHLGMFLPTDFVFPLFIELSKKWGLFRDLVYKLSAFNKVYFTDRKIVNKIKFDNFLSTYSQPQSNDIDVAMHAPEFSLPVDSRVKIFRTIPTECKLEGFCCWKLVLTKGVVNKGILRFGVANYQSKFYAFCSPVGLHSFARFPHYYLKQVVSVIRENPPLISLLNASDLLNIYIKTKIIEDERTSDVVKKITNDVSVQSEIHPEPYIDKEYEWNVWNIKRKIIKNSCLLSNRKCQGISTTYTVSASIQTVEHKEVAVQTLTEHSSSTPYLINFISGLRGRKDDHQIVTQFFNEI